VRYLYHIITFASDGGRHYQSVYPAKRDDAYWCGQLAVDEFDTHYFDREHFRGERMRKRAVEHIREGLPTYIIPRKGFITLRPGRIDLIAVAKKYHRKGIGRKLVKHALYHSGQLYVGTPLDNFSAQAFYRSLGFIPCGLEAVYGP